MGQSRWLCCHWAPGASTPAAGEHASKRFWVASIIGSAAVLGFVFIQGAGTLRPGDIVMWTFVAAAMVVGSVAASRSATIELRNRGLNQI
jgi:hypothetical protein